MLPHLSLNLILIPLHLVGNSTFFPEFSLCPEVPLTPLALLWAVQLFITLSQQHPTTALMLSCWHRYKTELSRVMGIPPQDRDVYAWCKIFQKQVVSLTGKRAWCQRLWRKGFHIQQPDSCNNKSLCHSNLIQDCITAVHKQNLRLIATNSDEHIFFSRTVLLSIYLIEYSFSFCIWKPIFTPFPMAFPLQCPSIPKSIVLLK